MGSTGSEWPLRPIEDKARHEKNTELINRGNHKSALKFDQVLQDILAKEVKQGWMVPITIPSIHGIEGAEVAPVGMDQQWQAHGDGSQMAKYRLTHDQSFEASVGESVNSRVLFDQLDELYYGHCFSRIIHYIVSLRLSLPDTKILWGVPRPI